MGRVKPIAYAFRRYPCFPSLGKNRQDYGKQGVKLAGCIRMAIPLATPLCWRVGTPTGWTLEEWGSLRKPRRLCTDAGRDLLPWAHHRATKGHVPAEVLVGWGLGETDKFMLP